MGRKLLERYSYIKQSLAILAVFVVMGCAKEQEIIPDLDVRLTNAMVAASEGNGLEFYVLPASSDFASIPQDPANKLTTEKVELGKLLFHETGLASKTIQIAGELSYSCASCHHSRAGFQAGLRQSLGDGGVGFGIAGEGRVKSALYSSNEIDAPHTKSPSIMNIAYQSNVLWNGQFGAGGVNIGTEDSWTLNTPKEDNFLGFEGTETQAIAALAVHRMEAENSLCNSNVDYLALYEAAFPNEPVTKITTGLAIAAYERTVLANQAPFQQWLQGDKSALSEQEKEGALLFFTKGRCYECHNGQALNSMKFYALGMKDLEGPSVFGVDVKDDAKNGRGGFTNNDSDLYKFKVPQLYNMKDSPFYGHGGTFTTIRSIVAYKNIAHSENSNVDVSRLASGFVPLNLSAEEIDQLTLFLSDALYDPNLDRYVPGVLPSGLCFPNNDQQSKQDLGCN